MPVEDTGVGLTRQLTPIEPSAGMGGSGDLAPPAGAQPKAANSDRRPRSPPAPASILVIRKVLERHGGAPLLPLEQQGDERRGEDEGGGDLQAPGAEEMAAALPWARLPT